MTKIFQENSHWRMTALLLFAVSFFTSPFAEAARAPAAPKVTVVSSSISKNPLTAGLVQTSIVKFGSATSLSNLIVDIRVYNAAGNKMVSKKEFKKVSIAAGGTVTLRYDYASPINLDAGTYNIQVGVWSNSWATYLYETRETFQVVTATPVTTTTTTTLTTTTSTTTTTTTTTVPSVAQVSVVSSSISKPTLTAGEVQTSVVTLKSTAVLSNMIVDLRIYNSANQMIARKPFEAVSFPAGGNVVFQFDYQSATSLAAGTYNVQVGVWNSAWTTFLYEIRESFQVVSGTPATTTTTTTTTTLPAQPPTTGAIPTATRNIVSNPGFEYDSAAWDIFCCSSWSIDTTQPRSGRKALRIGPDGMMQTLALGNHIIPGQTYRVTVYGKLTVAGENAFYGIRLHDRNGNEVESKTVNFTSTSYQAFQTEFTAPASAYSAHLFFYKHQGTGNLFVDDIEITSISHPVADTYAYPSGTPAGGMHYPFASHKVPYVAGIRPTNATQVAQDDAVRRLYNGWKAGLSSRCGDIMVPFSNDKWATVSEGISYGMLMTVLMAGHDPTAQATFDGLFRFARNHPAYGMDPHLMNWAIKTDCSDGGGGWNAVDGDLDIAMGLLLADKQWGSNGPINYMAEAIKTINAMKLNNFRHDGMVGGRLHRTSDNMISHFRAFKKATGDVFWDKAVEKGYELMALAQSFSSRGLQPGWLMGFQENNIRPSTGWQIESEIEGDYDWNACRNPWRLATDYVTSGDPRAQQITMKINNFMRSASGGNPANIAAGYKLDGTVLWQYPSLSFVGPATAGALVDPANQAWLNSLWSYSSNTPLAGYYDNELQILSLIVASGNWWQP